uniref:Putative secreted mucin n=1 Tax=Amblyomma cajennense TaxID=34607 RepID=A0A023FCR1_AMBCJ
MNSVPFLVLCGLLSTATVRAVYKTQGHSYCWAPCDPYTDGQHCLEGCLCYQKEDYPRLGTCLNPEAPIPPKFRHPQNKLPLPPRRPGAAPLSVWRPVPPPRPGSQGTSLQSTSAVSSVSQTPQVVSPVPSTPGSAEHANCRKCQEHLERFHSVQDRHG